MLEPSPRTALWTGQRPSQWVTSGDAGRAEVVKEHVLESFLLAPEGRQRGRVGRTETAWNRPDLVRCLTGTGVPRAVSLRS